MKLAIYLTVEATDTSCIWNINKKTWTFKTIIIFIIDKYIKQYKEKFLLPDWIWQ